MTRTLPFVARCAAVTAAAAALAACEVNLNTEGLTAKEKRSFSVTGQPDLTLETFDGSIEIHSWDRNEVEVEIEKRGMEQALLDEMKIEAELPRRRCRAQPRGNLEGQPGLLDQHCESPVHRDD